MFLSFYAGIAENVDAARFAAAVVGAAIVSASARGLYMALPARWLCEFDEAPCELHMAGFRGAGGAPERAVKALAVFLAALYIFIAGGVSVWGGAAGVFLAAAAFSDMDYMIIPDQLMWAAAGCALAGACAHGVVDAGGLEGFLMGRAHLTGGSVGFWRGWADAAAAGLTGVAMGALTGGGLMLLSAVLSSVFYGAGAIGAGDIKMMLVCGALAGAPEKAVMMFTVAVISSALFITAGLAAKRLTNESFIPMAPFIALAAVIFI